MTIRQWVQTIVETVGAWDEIESHPHRFGGVEFKIGNVEIGHIHQHGMVDIPFTRTIREALVAAGAAQVHHLLHDSGWITFYLRDENDVQRALNLYQLSYLHKKFRKPSSRDAVYKDQVASLGFDARVTAPLLNRVMNAD